ncbi:MAG: hypothetical protein LBG76_03855 [Treponema sp.]|jgi:hypothetical protein|nr:hypothetical protein [Treponema sp.]
MKKCFVVLMALAMTLGGTMAFAEDEAPKISVTFGGEIRTGLYFNLKEKDSWNGNYEPYLNTRHDDADNTRARIKPSINFGSDWYGANMFGVSVQQDGPNWDSGLSFTKYDDVNIWIKPFQNNFLEITAIQTGSDWGTGGQWDGSTGDAALRFNFKPGVEGLRFGFTLGHRSWADPNGKDFFVAENFFKELGIGAVYDVSLIKLAAGFRGVRNQYSDDNRAYISAELRNFGVPGLKFEAQAVAQNIFHFSSQERWNLVELKRTEWEIDQGASTGPDNIIYKPKEVGTKEFVWQSTETDWGQGKLTLFGLVNFSKDIGSFGISTSAKLRAYPMWPADEGPAMGWLVEAEPSYKIIPDKLKGILYLRVSNSTEATIEAKPNTLRQDASGETYKYDQYKVTVKGWDNTELPGVEKDKLELEVSPRLEYSILKIGNAELWSFWDLGFFLNTGIDTEYVKNWRIENVVSIRFNWNF